VSENIWPANLKVKVEAAMPTTQPQPARQSSIDRLFHALGDPTRRAIVDALVDRPASVSKLAGPLGVTLTAVMQHLDILEEAGLVHTEKLGRVRVCRLEPGGFGVLEQWIREHRSAWEQKLDRLGEMLGEEDEGR
jgi:DNA-binding transcriptional ArsR family regulator